MCGSLERLHLLRSQDSGAFKHCLYLRFVASDRQGGNIES